MIGRTIAMVSMMLVSVAGTARADGVGWGPGSFDGVLAVIAVVAILGLWLLYMLAKYLSAVPPVKEQPPVLAAARVHRELSPPK